MSEELTALVTNASPEDLPALIGQLETAKAAAWARLLAPPQRMELDESMTVHEAARRLGLSHQWIYRNAKRLPFTRRIGRRVVCSVRGLAEWNGRQRA